MDINLTISEAPGITDWLVVAIYESTSASTVVDSQAFPEPHLAAVNLSFTNLPDVPYYVRVWQSDSSSPGGTLRHEFLYDPQFVAATLRDDLFLIADATSGFSSATGIGNCFYTDITLEGWKFDIERRGFGTMQPDVDYHYDDTIGKWTLLPTANTPTPSIQPQEVFIIHFQPKITVASPVVNIANLFADSFDVTDDMVLDNSYANKVGLIAGTGDHLTITLPSLSGVSDFKRFTFISEGGSHVLAKIACPGADAISFANTLETEMYLAQSEQLTIFKRFSAWYVFAPYGHHLSAGEIVHQYLLHPQNTVLANGQVLSRTTYARLWKYVQTLDASQLLSDTSWNNTALNNKGFYSTGDGTTTFRVPLLTAPGFLRAVDGTTRKAGSYESATMMDHKHDTLAGAISTNGAGGNAFHGLYNGSAGSGISDYTNGPVLQNGNTVSPVTGKAIVTTDGNPPDTGIYLSIRF